MTYKKMQERLNELFNKATAKFLGKFDFDVYGWLDSDDAEEYEDLMVKTGQQESREDQDD